MYVGEHTEAGRIKSMKNPNDPIGNRTSDFPTAPPRAVIFKPNIIRESFSVIFGRNKLKLVQK